MADEVTTPLRDRPAWKALERHHDADRAAATCATCSPPIPDRGERLTAEAAGLYLDYSKNRITDETIALLLAARRAVRPARAHRRDVSRRPHQRVREPLGAAHVALRMPRAASLIVDGVDVVAEVHEVLDRMAAFADRVRSGEWTGHTGKPIRNVVNIGIGGSDLGPVMAYEALRHYSRRELTFRFVSNVDSTDFVEATRDLERRRDAVHRLLQDVHDARDDDQRPLGARLGAGRAGRRGGDRQALRGRLHQRREGGGVRDRHRQHVRLLGLGRRPLLDGLGDRPVDDARDRARATSASCWPASTRWTSTSAPRRSSRTCRC